MEFCQLVSELYSRPLDVNRPLWQMWVIEGLAGGEVAIVNLLHHAYTDGVGVLAILDELMPDTPTELGSEPPAPWNPPPLPSPLLRLLWGIRDLPGLFIKNVPTFLRGMRDSRRINKRLAEQNIEMPPSPADKSIPKPFSYRIESPHRRFSCRSLPFKDFRFVVKTFGVTINDVFMSCVSGALRSYLLESGRAVDRSTLASMPMNA